MTSEETTTDSLWEWESQRINRKKIDEDSIYFRHEKLTLRYNEENADKIPWPGRKCQNMSLLKREDFVDGDVNITGCNCGGHL